MTSILKESLVVGGRTLTLETGRMAKQASGAIFTTYGETMILATATGSANPRPGMDFFPLTVEYEEKLYAAGKIPGGFLKREGRPGEKAILNSRLIDRPIRPLFPKGYKNDVQLITTVMSMDHDAPPEVTAMIGASAALHISHIPFMGPIGGVIVGLIDGEYIINPTVEQAEISELHLVVAGTADAVMMVEAGANEISEEVVLQGIMFGFKEVQRIVAFIEDFRAKALEMGLAKEKFVFVPAEVNEEFAEAVKADCYEALHAAVRKAAAEKMIKEDRDALLNEIKAATKEKFNTEEYAEDFSAIDKILYDTEKAIFREMIAKDKLRIDGRAINEVRKITCEASILARTHGSSLFTRGQTQILNVCTLGMLSEYQIIDSIGLESKKTYLHQYNFPPFSVGEARPVRSPGRREIGHGALAERALIPVLPAEADFPYTIRLVSEAIESNGSTSMGSVCASTMSLMDAGVPIKAPVSGIAMGLITFGDDFTVLTDLQGMEDFLGDMDFKVAGTAKGITAIQMDIKISGISEDILRQALAQAHEGRMFIMDKMVACIDTHRPALSEYAPRIINMKIHPDKIREVIGSGGKVIKKIIEETGANINIEDDGNIYIASVEGSKGDMAKAIIEGIVAEPEIGKIYNGKVIKIMDFGAFVQFIPGFGGMGGKEGLVHISQLANERVNKVSDICSEGEEMLVKVIGVDNATGKVKLSRKDCLPKE